MRKNLFCLTIPLLIIFTSAMAQRLPGTQTTSIRAPENVNTDGKIAEWKNKFQAYNNAAQIYYTIANSDTALYLVVQATDALTIRKIIAGGVTLSVSPVNSKSNKDAVAVTYPFFTKNNWPDIDLHNRPRIIIDTAVKIERIDSFIRASNFQLDNLSKKIKVKGIKALKDTLISVYNDTGIKAASQFDPRTAYNYELSIPLIYLGLSIDGQSSFNYQISLNGSNFAEGNTITEVKGGGTRITATGGSKLVPMADMQFIRSPVGFMGVCKLAKAIASN